MKKKPTVFRVQLIDTQLNSRLTFMDCGFCVYVCTFRQLNRLPTPGKLLLPTAVISGWGTLQIGGVCHSVDKSRTHHPNSRRGSCKKEFSVAVVDPRWGQRQTVHKISNNPDM